MHQPMMTSHHSMAIKDAAAAVVVATVTQMVNAQADQVIGLVAVAKATLRHVPNVSSARSPDQKVLATMTPSSTRTQSRNFTFPKI